MDVVRLFDCEDMDFIHYFYAEGDNYINCIEYMGETTRFCYTCPTHGDIEYKRYAKRSAKLAFYEFLSRLTGKTFPYGALTGIRPTKLAYMEIAEGRDYKKLFDLMHVSPENTGFVGRVIEVQRPFYAKKRRSGTFHKPALLPHKVPLLLVHNGAHFVDKTVCRRLHILP